MSTSLSSSSLPRRRLKQPKLIEEEILCYCGLLSPVVTAWTKHNSGRWFHGCSRFRGSGCGFFEWIDPPLTKRGVEVI